MKKNILIAVIALVILAPAQVFGQSSVEKISNSIDTFIQSNLPQYKKIERYKVTGINQAGDPTFEGESPLAFKSVKLPAGFPLEYGGNSETVYKSFIKDITSDKNKDYLYDLYSFTVIEKDGNKYFVMVQDYQVRTTKESVEQQIKKINENTLESIEL
jgi:hypothetical protein